MTDSSTRLVETVENFCALIESLPKNACVEQEWGLTEVLAHLVYWYERYLEQAQGSQNGISVELPHGRNEDLNNPAVQLFFIAS